MWTNRCQCNFQILQVSIMQNMCYFYKFYKAALVKHNFEKNGFIITLNRIQLALITLKKKKIMRSLNNYVILKM